MSEHGYQAEPRPPDRRGFVVQVKTIYRHLSRKRQARVTNHEAQATTTTRDPTKTGGADLDMTSSKSSNKSLWTEVGGKLSKGKLEQNKMQSLQPRQESEGDCQWLPGGNKSGQRAGRGRTMQEPPPSSQRRHHRSCWQEGEMLLPTLVNDKGGRKWHRESDQHITTDQVEPDSNLPSPTGQVFVLPGDKKLGD